MSDPRLFPGWDTMLWIAPDVRGDAWISTTPDTYREWSCEEWAGDVGDLCREYSVILAPRSDLAIGCGFWPDSWPRGGPPDGPFLEVVDGVIVAEWWRGGRFEPRDSYA